jgi:hypothetical protein
LACNGNPEPLERFVATALGNNRQHAANLNYWAYWVRELGEDQPDDCFMVNTDPRTWAGTRVLNHLVHRLDPGSATFSLNIHTLWSLVLARPVLLEQHPHLRGAAKMAVERAGDAGDALNPQARQELAGLAYAIRLAQP